MHWGTGKTKPRRESDRTSDRKGMRCNSFRHSRQSLNPYRHPPMRGSLLLACCSCCSPSNYCCGLCLTSCSEGSTNFDSVRDGKASSLWLKSASNCFNKVLYVGEPSL